MIPWPGDNMTLGQLIEALESAERAKLRSSDESKGVMFDFAGTHVTGLDSYRGFYDHLALGFGEPDDGECIETVAELLALCKGSIGKEFTGWKGGDYPARPETPIWVANPGRTGSTALVGLRDAGWIYILETRFQDH